jgi:hypothetical protein
VTDEGYIACSEVVKMQGWQYVGTVQNAAMERM